MNSIWSIISNLSCVIAVLTLWGVGANSPFWLKLTITFVVVTASIATVLWGNRKNYNVKGYTYDPNNNTVEYLLIKNSKKLTMDMLVSVYIRNEGKDTLVAIGALAENESDKDNYIQVNIEHIINNDLLIKIAKNEKMKKMFYIRTIVRFSDISDLLK